MRLQAVFLIIAILFAGSITSHQSFAQPKYDGSRAYVTIWFDHAFFSQKSALNNMTKLGIKGAILVRTGVVGDPLYMTWNDVTNYQTNGIELVDHTQTHPYFTNNTSQELTVQEILTAKHILQSHGVKVRGYIPPYDHITPTQVQIINSNFKWTIIPENNTLQSSQIINQQCSLVQDCYIQGSSGFNQNTLFTIHDVGKKFGYTVPVLEHMGVGVPPGPPLNNIGVVRSQIDYAIQHHTWLILSFHQIDDLKIPYHTSPKLFAQILHYVKQKVNARQLVVVAPSEGLGIH